MAAGIDHLKVVRLSQEACNDFHTQELADLADEYREHHAYLEARLATDVSRENIFMGGNIHTFPRIIIPSDEYDPAPEPRSAFAAVELWAADGTVVVRVSKEQDGNAGLIKKLTENRVNWMPGMSHRRAQQVAKLASNVLAASPLEVTEFAKPKIGAVDDEMIWRMRLTDMERHYDPDYQNNWGQVILSHTRTGRDFRSGKDYPEAYVDIEESEIDSMTWRYGQEGDSQTVSDQERYEAKAWLAHLHGHELMVATGGLRRAAEMVRTGQIVTPSRPHRDVRIWHRNDWGAL